MSHKTTDAYIENVGFEIDIRIESLKAELDEIGKQLHEKLNDIKKDMVK